MRDFLTKPGTSIKSTEIKQARAGKATSRRSIRRVVRKYKLISKTSSKGKEITPKNLTKRLIWAQQVLNWSILEWRSIVFTDECKLFPKRTKGRILWYKKGGASPYEEEPDLSYKGINVWGFVSYNGDRGLVKFNGTLKADGYLKILEDNLRYAIPEEEDPLDELIFMHDGAPSHRAKDVKNYLHNRVDVLSWPPQSPDLNSWKIYGQHLNKNYGIEGLKSRMRETYGGLEEKFLIVLHLSLFEVYIILCLIVLKK